jgi:hypothetical protein
VVVERHAQQVGPSRSERREHRLGHRDYKTTEVYADFAPDPTQGAIWAQRAFGNGSDAAEGSSRQDLAGDQLHWRLEP